MSAWIVSKKHIDALVTAAMVGNTGRKMRWRVPGDVPADAYQRGEPWGPGAAEAARASMRDMILSAAGRVGAMLWNENHLSVNHRYDQSEEEAPYVYEAFPASKLAPGFVLKQLDCYEYQSCEHPGWEASEARAWCDALRQWTWDRITIPGYEAAPWGVDA